MICVLLSRLLNYLGLESTGFGYVVFFALAICALLELLVEFFVFILVISSAESNSDDCSYEKWDNSFSSDSWSDDSSDMYARRDDEVDTSRGP